MKISFILSARFVYKNLLRPVIFVFDSEFVHDKFISLGELLGNYYLSKILFRILFGVKNKSLEQIIAGIDFKNPIGLAAGFDYGANLTQILPSIGFGFETIGTITNKPYEGNLKPRLGRFIKSQSLLVNKGFKNEGIEKVSKKLKKLKYDFPLGISIGKTNSKIDKMTQKQAVLDIVSAFKTSEKANLKNAYYELNISCPNLYGNVTFYPPKNLEELLLSVTSLKLKKPLFIKMPIEQTDQETIKMLDTIVKFSVKGVIFGNLWKNKKDKVLRFEEIRKYPVGNFSGKPTEQRSNELIKLGFKNYGKKLIIIGCGGVFSAKDAYKKIKLGASLVQFITGMVFEGPQLASQINLGLIKLLEKDGYSNISEAIGKDSNTTL
jgi:dihydroorotate dehydrogenase subfamily 2